MAKAEAARDKSHYRYGIAEWYGKSFVRLGTDERNTFARNALARSRPDLICPFRTRPDQRVLCTKKGGVCSMRVYRQTISGEAASVAPGRKGSLVTICPHRFKENDTIFAWIGETLLGHSNPLVVGEVGFLEREGAEKEEGESEDVGRIDNVLVHPSRDPVHWCALEMQAVYFSGDAWSKEFKTLRKATKGTLPFPTGRRRPDFRSSGPKRLMPQLQTKIPSLRRWGKKMAVVADRNFFAALGEMDFAKDVSNCDIAWFIVDYRDRGEVFTLEPHSVRLTTLERAVEGLTGGRPVSLEEFEAKIREKLGGNFPVC